MTRGRQSRLLWGRVGVSAMTGSSNIARTAALMLAVALVAPSPATAQKGGKDKASPAPAASTPAPAAAGDQAGKGGKSKVFDFTGLDISGRLRTPQLLYFLERANEELERASLERRSFIPDMVNSVNEEAL